VHANDRQIAKRLVSCPKKMKSESFKQFTNKYFQNQKFQNRVKSDDGGAYFLANTDGNKEGFPNRISNYILEKIQKNPKFKKKVRNIYIY